MRNRVLIFTSLGHFANDGAVFFVPVVIDLLESSYHIGAFLITTSLTLFYLSEALSANIFGSLIDRKSLHVQGMFIGIFSLSIGLILFSFALDGFFVPIFMLLSSVIAGIGASFYHPIGSSILQSNYEGRKLGIYLGINGSAGSLGRAIYPSLFFLAGLALASNTYSIILFGVLGVLFSVLILLGFSGYEVKREFTEIHEEKTKGNGNGSRNSVAKLAIAILTAVSFVRSFAFFGIISWIPEYISFDKGAGASISLGYTLTLMFAGGIFGQLFFGKLVASYDKRLLLIASTTTSALLMFLYINTTGLVSLVAIVLFGFFNFSGFPLFMSIISDYVPRGSSTASNALVWNVGGTGGQAVGPLAIGLMINGAYANLPVAFETLLAVVALFVIVMFKLPRPAKASDVPLFG